MKSNLRKMIKKNNPNKFKNFSILLFLIAILAMIPTRYEKSTKAFSNFWDAYFIRFIAFLFFIGLAIFIYAIIIFLEKLLLNKNKNFILSANIDTYSNDSGTITIISDKNIFIKNINFFVNFTNDPNDWVNGFFEDYNRINYKETIKLNNNIIAKIPYDIQFTSRLLAEFTFENIKQYVEDVRINTSFDFENDKEVFKESFLNPGWNLDVFAKGKIKGTIPLNIQDKKIIDYINSL